MDYQTFALAQLKSEGYRITSPRKLMIAALRNAEKPLNAYELAKEVSAQGGHVDVVTVYRVLEVFEKLKLVHKVGAGYLACAHFECGDRDHCHHQFVCDSCEKSFEFHVNDQKFLKEIEEKLKGFVIDSHVFQLGGICKSCNK